MGAHGLMNVLVIRPTPRGRGWKSTAATGVAFVYVNDSGRPLTPPERTRILVPPGFDAAPVASNAPPVAPSR